MSSDTIYQLIKSAMGLAPASVGVESIERVVTRRMKAVGIDEVDDYCQLIKTSAQEKQNLINEITVPETWFFRDDEPFKVLVDFAKKLRISRGRRRIKILSMPCSTGEEPYSIAMALCDAGFGKDDFSIDAIDISTRVLEKARAGIYCRNSFRGKNLGFRDKYFDRQGENYYLMPEIKATVKFGKGNVVSPDFMAGAGVYDVAFCRNLLIYFDYDMKCRVLKTLHSLMSGRALLVLGHAETGRMPAGLFETLNLPGAFAYLKSDGPESVPAMRNAPLSAAADQRLPASRNRRNRKPSKSSKATNTVAGAVVSSPRKQAQSPDEPLADIQSWVEFVQRLADEGRLKQALTECDKLIAAVPGSAQGYYLKGLVLLGFDADAEAMETFKKAVYLDPKHYQSLIHLSVLAEELGELRAAENFRARADRLRDSGESDAI